ncbi:MAG: MBL fold metallo-hydrolase [Anaerolineae bacterium]
MTAYQIGNLRLALLIDATGQIPGDSLFHPARRENWGPLAPHDEAGNVPIVVHGVLISQDESHTLVDTGFGEVEEPDRHTTIAEGLAQLGLQPKHISRVILTHGHGDHVLGNTIERSGKWLPAYPLAEYVIQAREVAYVQEHEAEIWHERLRPLQDRGQLRTIEGTTALSDTITCWLVPGHTIGHQIVVVRSDGATAAILGDLAIRSLSLCRPEWGPDWAWDSTLDVEGRRMVADWATDHAISLILPHDPEMPCVRLQRQGDSCIAQPCQASS